MSALHAASDNDDDLDLQRKVIKAATTGDLDYLRQQRPQLLQTARCPSGCTVLHWAAGSNQIPTLNYLLEQQQPDPTNNTGNGSSTPIFPSVDLPVTSRRARGRTPLHYACRNGHLSAVRTLVHSHRAECGARAKRGVTPFQLAVWQNHLGVCRFLVEECGVVAGEDVNDFGCGAVHWIGIAPFGRANWTSLGGGGGGVGGDGEEKDATNTRTDGSDLLPMAKWLASQPNLNIHALQNQGHSALHKAAWGGHLALLRYYRTNFHMFDGSPDHAGNYAADMADMAATTAGEGDGAARHGVCARYLREECSAERLESCAVLNVAVDASPEVVRRAYLAGARILHPDRQTAPRGGTGHRGGGEDGPGPAVDFDALREAYEHLTVRGGAGAQKNPSHSVDLLLKAQGRAPLPIGAGGTGTNPGEPDDDVLFRTRLISVLREYGDKGIDLCNVPKKWAKVWPDVPFDCLSSGGAEDGMALRQGSGVCRATGRRRRKKGELLRYIVRHAGDVVDIVRPGDVKGSILVVPRCIAQGRIDVCIGRDKLECSG